MSDSNKLKLILEHADEYYTGREYHFTDNGFVQYDPITLPSGKKTILISEIFVRKSARRTGEDLLKLISMTQQYGIDHGLDSAFCMIQENNPHKGKMQNMVKKLGFEPIEATAQCRYYKWSRTNDYIN